MSRRVLVIGGTGSFGRRLVHGLVGTTDFCVVVGARRLERAEAFVLELVAAFPGRAIEAVAIDRDTVSAERLRTLGIFAVADAAGPFQGAGMSLAEAAIGAGVHYVDLADARDFVAAFPRLDAKAKRAGVVAVTGASSTPALSHAVLERLTHGWRAIDTVEIAISPGSRAPRGMSLVEAILSWSGQPVRLFLDGAWQTRSGWGMLTRHVIDGLGRRWLSLCETPDLDLIPARFAVRRSAVFRAGLELSVLHLALSGAALLVRSGLVRSLRPFAKPFRAIAGSLSGFGTDRGGILVEAFGTGADGRPAHARWTLVAEAGDGPMVPTLPALALLRRLAHDAPPSGALACAGLLRLEEIDAEFRPYRIRTWTEVTQADTSLFARALGAGFHDMPEQIRAAHMPGRRQILSGEANVAGAERGLGRAIAGLFRLPQAGEGIPVTVMMEAREGKEKWTRDFAGRRFHTVLGMRRGGGLTERFGLITFHLHVPTSATGLQMVISGWSVGGIPLPLSLAPSAEASESVDAEGRFRFDVTIGLPLLGQLVRYRGWLLPAAPKTPTDGVP